MDKITVVCQKDHDKGYEDFQGKCLLCVVDELTEKREWVGLTDGEIDEWTPEIHAVVRAVEAKLKEKNT